MSETIEEEIVLLGDELTFERWLELMQRRPKNIKFEHYQFPTVGIKNQFLNNISSYPEQMVTQVLMSFLLPTGSLVSDLREIERFKQLIKDNQDEAVRLIKRVPYFRRMVFHLVSREEVPLREGITWIWTYCLYLPEKH